MFLPAHFDTYRHRYFAGAIALALHAILLALILFVSNTPAPIQVPPNIISLTLVSSPETVSDNTDSHLEETAISPESLPTPLQNQSVPVSILVNEINDGSEDDENDQNLEEQSSIENFSVYNAIMPLTQNSNTTSNTLRHIFCLSSSEFTRDVIGNCHNESDVLALLNAIGVAKSPLGELPTSSDLTPDQIRAFFGITTHNIAGQSSMTSGGSYTSSADEMRDSLPPQHPDPVFGD
jgi:protein TonB